MADYGKSGNFGSEYIFNLTSEIITRIGFLIDHLSTPVGMGRLSSTGREVKSDPQ